MKNTQPTRRLLLTLITLATAIAAAGCGREETTDPTNANNANVNVEVAKTDPTPAPSESPTSESPTPTSAPEAERREVTPPESSVSERSFSAKALRYESGVSINGWKIPTESRLWYKLRNRDRVSTDLYGEAYVKISECTEVYVYHQSGMKLPPCSRSNFLSRNTRCFTKGFGAVNHSTRVNCRSKINPIQTGSAEIVMDGTWFAVGYAPDTAHTLVVVYEGEVLVSPVIDPVKWTLGPPTPVKGGGAYGGSFYVTKPGETPGTTAGLPERVAHPLNELPKLYETEPFNLLMWVPDLKESLEEDFTDPPPMPPVPPLLPSLLIFERQYVGRPRVQELVVTNRNFEPMSLTEFSVYGDNGDEFKKLSDTCKDVPPKGRCVVRVEFSPKAEGERRAHLRLGVAGGTAHAVPLVGNGQRLLEEIVNLNPANLSFDIQKVKTVGGTKRVVITSEGTLPMKVTEVVVEGPGKDDYDITKDECLGRVIEKQCAVEIAFTPRTEGDRNAKLTVRAQPVGDPAAIPDALQKGATYNVALAGAGGTPVVAYEPAQRCFYRWKEVDPKTPLDRAIYEVTVFSKGLVPLSVKSVGLEQEKQDYRIVSDTCKGKNVTDKCVIRVAFTPRDDNMRRGTLVINHDDAKASPTRIPLRGVGKPRNWFIRFFDNLFGDTYAPC